MSSSRFPAEGFAAADASVVINLNATGRAEQIVAALPFRIQVPGSACLELEDGTRIGHDDSAKLRGLIDAGLMDRIEIGPGGAAVYEALIDGAARVTLDDGEAAAIACAVERDIAVLLDERKARRLCGASYPGVALFSTAELLLHEQIATALGPDDHVEAVVRALRQGRMRVPPAHCAAIVALIGAERAAACASLPRAARPVPTRTATGTA